MGRRKRILIGFAFGSFISVLGWALDLYLAHLGIFPAATSLDDLTVGVVSALLAYAWVTLLTERHSREQIAQKARQEAVLEERGRMAREFHDTVAQKLAGIVLQLEAGENFLKGHPAAMHCLDQAAELARQGLQDARESVWNLRPEALRGMDLAGAVAGLARNITERTDLRVEFVCQGFARKLPNPTEKELLRIAQEALTNVVKHARANKVNIELAFSEEQLQLSVQDDGIGFTPECPPLGAGFGLTSMRDRASALGGICWIYSQPSQGTSVQALVPLSRS